MSPMASPKSVRPSQPEPAAPPPAQSGCAAPSPEIGGALGMTRSTIGELVADLRARGLVEEGDPARLGCARTAVAGRPSEPRRRRGHHRRDRRQLAVRGGRRARRPDPPPRSGHPSATSPGGRPDDRGRRQAHPDRAGIDPGRLLGLRARHRGRRGRPPRRRLRALRAEPRVARRARSAAWSPTGSGRACR